MHTMIRRAITSVRTPSYFLDPLIRHAVSAVAAVFLCCAAFYASGATLQEIKERGYIVVVTENDCPPYEYAMTGGRAGYDHDLLVNFTLKTGLQIHQELASWQDILPGVASGKYDLAATAAVVSRERAKSVDFTMPTAEMTMVYMKRKSDKSIGSLKQLAGKTIGVQKDGASADAIATLKDELKKSRGKLGKVVAYRTYAEAYEDLVKHKIDAVINNSDALRQLATATSGLFEVGETIGGKSYVGWAVRKGNRELLEFVNGFLGEQKSNGTFAELQRKYRLNFAALPDQPFPGAHKEKRASKAD